MALFLRSTKLAAKLTQGTTKCFSRNYADQMNFTFAAANQVSLLILNVQLLVTHGILDIYDNLLSISTW